MGRRPGADALPAPGGGAARPGHRVARDRVHAHRVGQVPDRDGRALRRDGPGPAHLLHGADQGPGQREVLRPGRGVRRRERRHDHRRLVGQPRRTDHLLHRRDPGEHRPAHRRWHRRGRRPPRRPCRPGRRRGGPGGDGRVPLLLRPAARLGVAGAAAGAAAHAVRADVRDPRGHLVLRRRPQAPHRGRRGRGDERRATRAAELRVRDPTVARAGRLPGGDRPLTGVPGALHAEGRRGAGPVPDVHHRGEPRAAGRDLRRAGRVPVRHRVRHHAVALPAPRRRRAPRRDAAALPTGGRAPHPARAADGGVRHRHPRRGDQRADPDRRADLARQVRRRADATPVGPRVPPDRGAGRAGRVRHVGRGDRARAGARDREPRRSGPGRRRPEEGQEDRPQEGTRRPGELDRADLRAAARRPARAVDLEPDGEPRDGAQRAGPPVGGPGRRDAQAADRQP